MVKALITARNPNDSMIRVWGLGIDKLPVGNWLKDPSIVKVNKRSGELWETDLPLSDGKHVLYFIISQTDPPLGGYTGEALFDGPAPKDGAGFNFNNIDNDTIAEFPVTIKSGKATRDGSATSTTQEVPENRPGVTTKVRNVLSGIKTKVTDANKKQLAMYGGIAIAAGIGGYVGYKLIVAKKRKRF